MDYEVSGEEFARVGGPIEREGLGEMERDVGVEEGADAGVVGGACRWGRRCRQVGPGCQRERVAGGVFWAGLLGRCLGPAQLGWFPFFLICLFSFFSVFLNLLYLLHFNPKRNQINF
jgi:hypothetical protein